MTTITIPRETFDQMQEALESVGKAIPLGRSTVKTCYAINNIHRDAVHDALSAAKAVQPQATENHALALTANLAQSESDYAVYATEHAGKPYAVTVETAETAETAERFNASNQPQAQGDRKSWLIEITAGAIAPGWLCGPEMLNGWTKDANAAISFPSKEVAKKVFARLMDKPRWRSLGFDKSCYAITEHLFVDAHPQASEPQSKNDACEVLATVLHFIPASEPDLLRDVTRLCHDLRTHGKPQASEPAAPEDTK